MKKFFRELACLAESASKAASVGQDSEDLLVPVIYVFKLLTTGQVFRFLTQRDKQSLPKEVLHLFTSSPLHGEAFVGELLPDCELNLSRRGIAAESRFGLDAQDEPAGHEILERDFRQKRVAAAGPEVAAGAFLPRDEDLRAVVGPDGAGEIRPCADARRRCRRFRRTPRACLRGRTRGSPSADRGACLSGWTRRGSSASGRRSPTTAATGSSTRLDFEKSGISRSQKIEPFRPFADSCAASRS